MAWRDARSLEKRGGKNTGIQRKETKRFTVLFVGPMTLMFLEIIQITNRVITGVHR